MYGSAAISGDGGGGRSGFRQPVAAEPTDDDTTVVGVTVLYGVGGALSVPESEGDGAPGSVVVGPEGAVAEPPVVGGAAGMVVAPPAVPVGLGGTSDVSDVLGRGDAGLVTGSGRGACGLFSTRSWGSRKRPMVSPATARTEPTAFRTARAQRRARTPDRRRL